MRLDDDETRRQRRRLGEEKSTTKNEIMEEHMINIGDMTFENMRGDMIGAIMRVDMKVANVSMGNMTFGNTRRDVTDTIMRVDMIRLKEEK